MKPKQAKPLKYPRTNIWKLPKPRLAASLGFVVLIVMAALWLTQPDNPRVSADRAGSVATGKLAGKYAYQVGNPGPGQMAPPIHLVSTAGSEFDLASWRGKTVLLYFQEGITCQACWDQNKDIARSFQEFRALGLATIITIATDPVNLLKERARDAGLSTPVLSDPQLTVSTAYHANDYGMMGRSRDGHTFVVVGPDGRIKWRADYGGQPNYTMYVPVANLLADLRQGLHKIN